MHNFDDNVHVCKQEIFWLAKTEVGSQFNMYMYVYILFEWLFYYGFSSLEDLLTRENLVATFYTVRVSTD